MVSLQLHSLIVADIAKLKATIDAQIQALAVFQKEKDELEKQRKAQQEKEEREKQLKIQKKKKGKTREGKKCIIVSVIFLITLVERIS